MNKIINFLYLNMKKYWLTGICAVIFGLLLLLRTQNLRLYGGISFGFICLMVLSKTRWAKKFLILEMSPFLVGVLFLVLVMLGVLK